MAKRTAKHTSPGASGALQVGSPAWGGTTAVEVGAARSLSRWSCGLALLLAIQSLTTHELSSVSAWSNPSWALLTGLRHPGSLGGQEGDADPWWTMEVRGVDLVVSGHNHAYERFAQQDHTTDGTSRDLLANGCRP
jgi:hypothetical protein